MPFNRPTLSDLVGRVRDDIDTRMPGADSRLRRSVLDVIARIHAAATSGLYGYLDWIWRQVFPDSAEAAQLNRWAAIWGVTRKAATVAGGSVHLNGDNDVLIPADTALLRSDGVEYRTSADVTIAAGVASVAIAALDAGSIGNAIAGQQLTFASPVAGVGAIATIAGDGIVGGSAEEEDEALRARLLDRIRRPPHGGNQSDYERWALEVVGVTRAWIYPQLLGPGTVSIYFVMDGRDDPIPTADDVAIVQAYIDAVRPVTAAVSVFAPIPEPLNLTIQAVPPTDAVKTAIAAEIADLLYREAEPGGTILISHIREAVSIAAGETDHVIDSPIGNVTTLPGKIYVPGIITWAAP